VLIFFLVYEIIWLFAVLVELLALVYVSFLFMKVWLFVLSLWDIEVGMKVLMDHDGNDLGTQVLVR
jgi:hypothetical protein